MNSSIVRYTLGQVLKIEAALLLLPCIVALIYSEKHGYYFLLVAGMCALLGFGMALLKPESNVFYLKEGCIITALSWIFLSFFGCLPFYLSGEIKAGERKVICRDFIDKALAKEYFKKATSYLDMNSAWAFYNLIKNYHKDYDNNIELMNEHMDYIKELNPKVYDLAMEL